MTAEIRPVRPGDLSALYHIALVTGDAGQDASDLYGDPRLVGHLYAAPYAVLSPETSFVAQDEGGVCGYIVGTLDTAAFGERLEAEWWPALRAEHADPDLAARGDWSADDNLRYQIHHPQPMARRLLHAYPSHLHVNLLPRQQGRGMGRKMIDRWLETIWDLGSPGAHLGVDPANHRAKRFYQAYGWDRLDLGLPPEAVVFGMGRPHSSPA